MKKIKMFAAAAMLCAAAFAGYTAYDQATMTEQEELLQANLEALTWPEWFEEEEYSCENSVTVGKEKVFYCGTCDWVENSTPNGDNGTCKK